MVEHWIEARDAARIVQNTDALCERLAAGLIRHRAQRITVEGDQVDNSDFPENFWSLDGRERLKQDWEAGNFVSNFDGLTETKALQVQFEAADVLDSVPFENRAAAALSLSVAGSPAWLSARDTRHFAYEQAGLYPLSAGDAVVAQCRLGFISARAIEVRWAVGRNPDKWTVNAREWNVPTWFWKDFMDENASTKDWEKGLFAGQGSTPKGHSWITLEGVHFLRSSLDVLLPKVSATVEATIEAKRPALPEAQLLRWWAKIANAREGLSQEQLRALANHDHPQHSVSRDRIRALAEGRKPGPKTN